MQKRGERSGRGACWQTIAWQRRGERVLDSRGHGASQRDGGRVWPVRHEGARALRGPGLREYPLVWSSRVSRREPCVHFACSRTCGWALLQMPSVAGSVAVTERVLIHFTSLHGGGGGGGLAVLCLRHLLRLPNSPWCLPASEPHVRSGTLRSKVGRSSRALCPASTT